MDSTSSGGSYIGDLGDKWKLDVFRSGKQICWVRRPAYRPPRSAKIYEQAKAEMRWGRSGGCTGDLVETAAPVQFGYSHGAEVMFAPPESKQVMAGAVDDRITSITIHLKSGGDLHLKPSPTGLFNALIGLRDRVDGIEFHGTDLTVRCTGGPIDKISWASCKQTGS